MSRSRPAAEWRPDPQDVDQRGLPNIAITLLRLDAESRARRLAAVSRTSCIRGYVDTSMWLDYHRRMAFSLTACCAAPPNCDRSADLRSARRPRPPSASRPAGRATASAPALLERTLLTARNRGITHLHMACLAENRRMQQLAPEIRRRTRVSISAAWSAKSKPRIRRRSRWCARWCRTDMVSQPPSSKLNHDCLKSRNINGPVPIAA